MLYGIKKYLYHLYQLPFIFKMPYKTADEINDMQNRKLRETINYAYNNVPFYRDMFRRNGIKTKEILNKDDLKKIPILEKNIIKKNYKNIISSTKPPASYRVTKTSGSCGEQLMVVVDDTAFAKYRLMQFRQLVSLGYKFNKDKIGFLRPFPGQSFLIQRFGMFKREFISSLLNPDILLDQIEKIRPNILYAYPSSLYLIANEMRSKKIENFIKLKFIISNSEKLEDEVRKYIEKTFKCKVYDDYSCLEILGLGFECKCQKLHVAADNVIIEILDDKGERVLDGQEGNIVITSLNNRAMPYIRYKIGDIGSIKESKCECGIRFPIFSTLLGRNDDFLISQNGKLISPRTLSKLMRNIPEISEFQVVQKTKNDIIVKTILVSKESEDRVFKIIEKGFNDIFQGHMNILIKNVNRIERGSTGKHRYLINYVRHPMI